MQAVLRMPAKTLRSIRLLARAIVTSQESVTKLLTQASDPLKLLLSPYGPTDAPLLLRAVTLHKISALKAMLAFVPKHQGTHPFKFKVDDVVTQGPHWPPYLTGYGPEGRLYALVPLSLLIPMKAAYYAGTSTGSDKSLQAL
jgi:hypothetical protein